MTARKIPSRPFPPGKRRLPTGPSPLSAERRRRWRQMLDVTRWAMSNPDKKAAHRAVAAALRAGLLRRLPCEVCGARRAQAHHDDYRRPLDVRWLCGPHHRAHHASEARKDVT